MFDSVGGATGMHIQRCQVFHAHVQQLRIFEQRDPHLSQVESYKQDSSDVPVKSNRCSINREIGVAKGLIHQAQSHHTPNVVFKSYQREQNVSFEIALMFMPSSVAAVAEWYRYRTVACFVTGSSPVPLKTRRVGQRCTLNLSRAETSSRWCGVVVRRGGCQLMCRPRHLTMVQNYVVRHQKPSCS
ncbi:uncharacterized protein TNCV_4797921 [Trichonephila clavipes]|nr:uncharacterized protein TNCV_4797921 [Trichonephila clavipes]